MSTQWSMRLAVAASGSPRALDTAEQNGRRASVLRSIGPG
jgi:hypothetical protein